MEKKSSKVLWLYPIVGLFFMILFGYKIENMTHGSGLGFLAVMMILINFAFNFVLVMAASDDIFKKIKKILGEKKEG